MSIEQARALDRSEELLDAAALYEKAVQDGTADVSVYLDLAVLYFVLLDFGEVQARELPVGFQDEAWKRTSDLLEEAEARFGPDAEIEFWKRYVRHIILGEEFSSEECRALCVGGQSLVPHMFLYASTRGTTSKDEAARLLKDVEGGETARKRYVRSILESPTLQR